MVEENTLIYGKHPVKEALNKRPDIARAIYIADGLDDPELFSILGSLHIPISTLNLKKLPKDILSDSVHQGVVLEIDPRKLMQEYTTFIQNLNVTNNTALVILGEVHDPHNVGAVIRSAAAFGISGVLIPEYRQAQATATVIKVSAGMAFHVPLVQIGNVNNTIADLKERDFWIYGLEDNAKQSVTTERFEKPSVFILGNEATGIRKKTIEHCDIILGIPMVATAESLNASVAASVVLYAWSTQHNIALR